MPSTMARPEDTVKVVNPSCSDALEDDGMTEAPDSNIPAHDSNSDTQVNGADTVHSNGPISGGSGTKAAANLLTHEEVIELARRSVENGVQETKRSLAGNEAVSDVVKPKLTIDLGHSNIGRIPEAVVDVIKDEVERCVYLSYPLLRLPYWI